MKHTLAILAVAAVAAAGAQAATISTTVTLTNAPVAITASGITVSGPITMSNIGGGTFSTTLALTSITGQNASAPFTISVSSGGTITGTLTIPSSLLTGGSATSGAGTMA